MGRNSLKNVMRLIDVAKVSQPVEQEFLSDLKRSIELDSKRKSGKPSQTYKPSSMNCVRQSYYQIVGKTPDPTSSSYVMVGICNSGSDIHVRLQSAINNMVKNGMNCEYINVADFVKMRNLNLEIKGQQGVETKLYDKKLNMSFLCDGIIKYKNKYYILELKTETSNKWWDRKGVDESHYNQATAYSIAFGLDDIIFIYINRDILDMKSFLFHVTDDMKQNLIGYIEECDSYIRKLQVPPKPENVSKKTCEYCNYKQSCKSNIEL